MAVAKLRPKSTAAAKSAKAKTTKAKATAKASTKTSKAKAAPAKAAATTAKAAPVEAAPAPAKPKAKTTAARTKAAAKAIDQRAQQARRASILLKHVSDPTRLQVILILAEGERHVGALCEQLSQSQPAVSHHLALLRHGNIIAPRRQGKNNFYSLTETGEELARVVQSLIPS